MQFTTVLALLLPVVAASAVPRDAAAPAVEARASPEAVCQSQSMGYGEFCDQCMFRCQYTPALSSCYYATFISIKDTEDWCKEHGNGDCRNFAVNSICHKW